MNTDEVQPSAFESKPQLLFKLSNSEETRVLETIKKFVKIGKEMGAAFPLLTPASIHRQEGETTIVRSKEDQFALVEGSDRETNLDFTPVHACLGIALRGKDGKRMCIHVRKRVFDEADTEGMKTASERIADQIVEYWGDGKPEEVVFLSEYLRDPRFPYQALIIAELLKRFTIPPEKQGFLQGEFQFQLRHDTQMPHGTHETVRESPFKLNKPE